MVSMLPRYFPSINNFCYVLTITRHALLKKICADLLPEFNQVIVQVTLELSNQQYLLFILVWVCSHGSPDIKTDKELTPNSFSRNSQILSRCVAIALHLSGSKSAAPPHANGVQAAEGPLRKGTVWKNLLCTPLKILWQKLLLQQSSNVNWNFQSSKGIIILCPKL